MAVILVVEDDRNARLLTTARLKPHYTVISAADGEEALDLYSRHHVDLIVADVMMPKMNGYELVRNLRSTKHQTPVILLTAKSAFNDKRTGFEAGIDDYMTKPVNYEELLWRINALLRRSNIQAKQELAIGPVTIDARTYSVTRSDPQETYELPKKEFDLLFLLLSYPDMIFTKNQLIEEIWGMDSNSDENTIKTHINRLRTKFSTWPEFQIITIRGLGYKAHITEPAE